MKELKMTLSKYQRLKSFVDQYKWKGIEFPSHSKVWQKFKQNNKTVALNILFVPHNTEKKKVCVQIKI